MWGFAPGIRLLAGGVTGVAAAGLTGLCAAGPAWAIEMGLTTPPVELRESPDLDFSFSRTMAFDSEYIFRGRQLAEMSVQPSVDIAYGPFQGGFSGNLPIRDLGQDEDIVPPAFDPAALEAGRAGNSFRIHGGMAARVSRRVVLDMGASYYMLPERMTGFFDVVGAGDAGEASAGANSFEPFLGLALDVPARPGVTVYRDIHVGTTTLEGRAGHVQPLWDGGEAALEATVGHVSDDRPRTNYAYYSTALDLKQRVSEKATVSAGVRWAGASRDLFFDDVDNGVFSNGSFRWSVALRADF